MFFAAENLTSQTLIPCNPWEFVPTETITEQIRQSKEDRQNWYQNPATKHCFYTGIEPTNPNMRPGKDNPPLKIHALSADYDVAIPDERVDEAVKAMKIKPSWKERSLGGNVRLVWIFPRPLIVDDYQFCGYILEQAMEWLNLGLLPALDEAAFKAASRLLCNGCQWTATGFGPVPEIELQSFFVECGRNFRFRPVNDTEIPLADVEKKLRELYPTLNWPGEFVLESQGPTFWIPESVSPLSAIVKPLGMFTFSAHATKPFYSWSEIIGKDFVENFTNTAIAKATADIHWDSKKFWRKKSGFYASMGEKEMANFLRVDCKLSAKADKTGVSPMDVALSHIFNHNCVKAAVPFVFRPGGPIEFLGERVLNTYVNRVVPPATGTQTWGPQGGFPFLSFMLDNIFEKSEEPTKEQLPRFLAWFKYYYTCAFEQIPLPGQNTFLMGGVGIGKTFLNRSIVGTAVGGFMDASDYLVNGAVFNSHLMHVPHWCLDDDTPANSQAASAKMHAMFKKTVANQQFLSNEKFQVSGMTEWMGRIGCTTNLDYLSTRIVGPLDNSSLDKTNLFRCVKDGTFRFPTRVELVKIALRETPLLLRWLLDWKVPDEVPTDPRYGFASFQESSLLDQSHQTNPAMPFKEVLMTSLDDFFKENPGQPFWMGPVSQLIKMIVMNPLNDYIIRSIKMEQVNRYLEQILKEGLLPCETETGPMKTRLWKFKNPAPAPSPEASPAASGPTAVPFFVTHK